MATIAVLHAGELGSALAKLLAEEHRVITSVEGRSAATVERANSCALEIVGSLQNAIDSSEAVLSSVTPSESLTCAHAVARCGQVSPTSLYIDLNSNGADQLQGVTDTLSPLGWTVIGGAVHGGAHRLAAEGTVYLSGDQSGRGAELFEGILRVVDLGSDLAQAKQLKLLLGGIAKCSNLLQHELRSIATGLGLEDLFESEIRSFYPFLSDWYDRYYPTFANHADRRLDELQDLNRLSQAASKTGSGDPTMVGAAASQLRNLIDEGDTT